MNEIKNSVDQLTAALEYSARQLENGWTPETARPGDTAIALLRALAECASDLYIEADEVAEAGYDSSGLNDLSASIHEKVSRLATLLGLPPTCFYGPG
mgnify:CR=1 FL=1